MPLAVGTDIGNESGACVPIGAPVIMLGSVGTEAAIGAPVTPLGMVGTGATIGASVTTLGTVGTGAAIGASVIAGGEGASMGLATGDDVETPAHDGGGWLLNSQMLSLIHCSYPEIRVKTDAGTFCKSESNHDHDKKNQCIIAK